MNYIGMTVMERMFCILMNIRIINFFKGELLVAAYFLRTVLLKIGLHSLKFKVGFF